MISKNQIVIVIPTYKTKLNEIEKVSLSQVFNVLAEYDITFIVPDSLEINYDECKDKKYAVEYFSDYYFKSTETYSELCLSTELYNRFSNYNYILIYQLDAFVFSDRLLEFCKKGYDYIGAPTPTVYWPFIRNHIGNGGFSLRRIDSMLKIMESKDDLINRMLSNLPEETVNGMLNTEDKFICYCIENFFPDFIMPSLEQALDFSVEYNINGVYNRILNKLPFGVHKWDAYKFDFWWGIIQTIGYVISDNTRNMSKEHSNFIEEQYELNLLKLIYKTNISIVKEKMKIIIGQNKVSLWGHGKNFEICVKHLKSCDIEICNVYDRNNNNVDNQIVYPDRDSIIKDFYPIIISTTKYMDEVSEELENYEKRLGKDYFTIPFIEKELIRELEIDVYGEVLEM